MMIDQLRLQVQVRVTTPGRTKTLASFDDDLPLDGHVSFLKIGRLLAHYEELGGHLRAELANEGQDLTGDVAAAATEPTVEPAGLKPLARHWFTLEGKTVCFEMFEPNEPPKYCGCTCGNCDSCLGE
ncbi:hypothetical protein [Actinomadura sp. NPDC048394]|uniref:hypothetical protein n=1 Tax=Actinomadura sp. NPDC048394 TaxID=3158223 RepID=UPI00340D72AE